MKILQVWILMVWNCIYLLYGVVLISITPPVLTSATGSLVYVIGISAGLSGIIFFFTGLFGLLAMVIPYRIMSLAMMLPSVSMIIYGALNAFRSAYIGVYSNGYPPPIHPHLFIFIDQLPAIVLPITYSIAMILFLNSKEYKK